MQTMGKVKGSRIRGVKEPSEKLRHPVNHKTFKRKTLEPLNPRPLEPLISLHPAELF